MFNILYFGVIVAIVFDSFVLLLFDVCLMPPELPAARVFVMLFFKFFVASTSAGLLLFAVRAKWRPRRSHRKKTMDFYYFSRYALATAPRQGRQYAKKQ